MLLFFILVISRDSSNAGTELNDKSAKVGSGGELRRKKGNGAARGAKGGAKGGPADHGVYERANATFVTLARNSDLWDLADSIRSVEDRFNNKYHYDWVFLNNEPFDEEFIKLTTRLISGKTKYGLIDKEHWGYPPWISEQKAAQTREDMKNIIYGSSETYRHMCRYESGFFYRHELMQDYRYYWRVEPETKMHCDINYDLFKFMETNKKKYGFVISLKEYQATIPTLWDTTMEFLKKYPQYLHKNSLQELVSNDNLKTYNLCHFWTNFEIADMEFWRGEAYSKYFDHLDHNGGFFYERWGDAPVHSIAASLFLDKSEVHFFDHVGYYHGPFHNCPIDEKVRDENNCLCNPKDDLTWHRHSCTNEFYELQNWKKPEGWKEARQ